MKIKFSGGTTDAKTLGELEYGECAMADYGHPFMRTYEVFLALRTGVHYERTSNPQIGGQLVAQYLGRVVTEG